MSTGGIVPYLSFQQEQPEPQLTPAQVGRPVQILLNGIEEGRAGHSTRPGGQEFGGPVPTGPTVIHTRHGQGNLTPLVSMEIFITVPARRSGLVQQRL